MDYLLIQMLNGVQLGLLMFLLAAGLTLTEPMFYPAAR